MLKSSRTVFLALVLVIPALGCGVLQQSGSGTGFSGLPDNNTGGGIAFSGAELFDHGGTLLSFLYPRVSGMSVDYAAIPCPGVQLRGRKSIFGSNNPLVYLDGTRTANSCILEMLSTRDVTRVEVYPMGISNRPGYQTHPNGLILVFAHDGS